jgi:hypothetical protein
VHVPLVSLFVRVVHLESRLRGFIQLASGFIRWQSWQQNSPLPLPPLLPNVPTLCASAPFVYSGSGLSHCLTIGNLGGGRPPRQFRQPKREMLQKSSSHNCNINNIFNIYHLSPPSPPPFFNHHRRIYRRHT